MISVTMDLMDMSELPDLSSSVQAPAITSLTDISTFSAQPPPTGEYFVLFAYFACYGHFLKSYTFTLQPTYHLQ